MPAMMSTSKAQRRQTTFADKGVELFADKVARHPESLGVGVVTPAPD